MEPVKKDFSSGRFISRSLVKRLEEVYEEFHYSRFDADPLDIFEGNKVFVLEAFEMLEKYAEKQRVINPIVYEAFRQLEVCLKKSKGVE